MRSLPAAFFYLSLLLVISGCHKTGVNATGFVGTWQLVQLTGGLAIDVIPVDRNNVSFLKLLPDSTRQEIYNGRLIGAGSWSVKALSPSADSPYILTYGTAVPTGITYADYHAWLSPTQLIIKMIPDVGYKAVYARSR